MDEKEMVAIKLRGDFHKKFNLDSSYSSLQLTLIYDSLLCLEHQLSLVQGQVQTVPSHL